MPCLPEWSVQISLFNLISYHSPFVCFTVITLAFLLFGGYSSGSLHFLSPLLYTSPPPPDLCLIDKLTSFLRVSSNALSPEEPLIPHPLTTLCLLIMLHFFPSPASILYSLICFLFFFLECNLNYLKSGTLFFPCCIPIPKSTSSIK